MVKNQISVTWQKLSSEYKHIRIQEWANQSLQIQFLHRVHWQPLRWVKRCLCNFTCVPNVSTSYHADSVDADHLTRWCSKGRWRFFFFRRVAARVDSREQNISSVTLHVLFGEPFHWHRDKWLIFMHLFAAEYFILLCYRQRKRLAPHAGGGLCRRFGIRSLNISAVKLVFSRRAS